MGKLVRDKVPEIIRADGRVAETRLLDHQEWVGELWQKLREEVEELQEAPTEKVTEELADVLEVLRAIALDQGLAWDHVEQVRERKAATRGGFDARVYLC